MLSHTHFCNWVTALGLPQNLVTWLLVTRGNLEVCESQLPGRSTVASMARHKEAFPFQRTQKVGEGRGIRLPKAGHCNAQKGTCEQVCKYSFPHRCRLPRGIIRTNSEDKSCICFDICMVSLIVPMHNVYTCALEPSWKQTRQVFPTELAFMLTSLRLQKI